MSRAQSEGITFAHKGGNNPEFKLSVEYIESSNKMRLKVLGLNIPYEKEVERVIERGQFRSIELTYSGFFQDLDYAIECNLENIRTYLKAILEPHGIQVK